MTRKTELQAGAARRIITPPPGIFLIGYGDRSKGNTGVHDDLTATALAVDDGLHRAVILACDLLAINEHTVARIQAQTGSNVVICYSGVRWVALTRILAPMGQATRSLMSRARCPAQESFSCRLRCGLSALAASSATWEEMSNSPLQLWQGQA